MTNIDWTGFAHRARENEYEGPCVVCGNRLPAHAGKLVATRSPLTGEPRTNGVVHNECKLPESGAYLYRARKAWASSCDAALAELRGKAGNTEPSTSEPPPSATPEPESPSEQKAEPAPATPDELKLVARELLSGVTQAALEKVPELVRGTLLEMTRTVEIKVGTHKPVKVENAHAVLSKVAAVVGASNGSMAPFLVGPAGSGKTTLAKQVADVLKLEFYAENRVTSEYKLVGFMDAKGEYVRTAFRNCFEFGGLFLLDEVDASDPDVLTALNAGLANDFFPFPDGIVKKHKNFRAIAAGNTYGRGADREYVGRNQLDAATLDRFVFITVDYDENAELAWATNDDWTTRVQKIRKAVSEEKVRLIVSPRASIYGGELFATGVFTQDEIEEMCIWKGLDSASKARIVARMGGSL